jgi:tetratricopeptide (TPR) repeat protein
MPQYVEARLLYDQGKYDEALALFERAAAALEKPGAPPIAELHFYLGDILIRQERTAEAEAALLEELRAFPKNLRARGALALLYHAGGRSDEASGAVSAIRAIPTPDGYATAARLRQRWRSEAGGDGPRRGRRVFAEPRNSPADPLLQNTNRTPRRAMRDS